MSLKKIKENTMQDFLSKEEAIWLEDTFHKIDEKLTLEVNRIGDKICYLSEDGAYQKDYAKENISWWTNGFFAGMLWQMYHATGKEVYVKKAKSIEKQLDLALEEFEGLYHDVGFMWMHTAVADYKLTKNKNSYVRGMHAATLLAGRFNILGNYIRAWNEEKSGWMICDCMMNLSLLYWATNESKDPRFAAIAQKHAQKTMEVLLREDGSSNHIAILDPTTGELLETPAGQGYKEGSSWSRGQAWILYGFAISYAHTKDEQYLNVAKRSAHYFLANVALNHYLPLCDFRAPKEPIYYDSSAGACAACGLLEIAKHVPEYEKQLYQKGALNILQAMEERFANWDMTKDGILGMGKVAYHDTADRKQDYIVYADYFFTEAVLRLLEKDFFIW